MFDRATFLREVYRRVPAYRDFLAARDASVDGEWEDLPLLNRQNYLTAWPVERLCWDGSLRHGHLIEVGPASPQMVLRFWPRRPSEESVFVESLQEAMVAHHHIDTRRTLLIVCLPVSVGSLGPRVISACRLLASSGRFPVTLALPGLDLGEAVECCARFGDDFDQVIWVTELFALPFVTRLLEMRGVELATGRQAFVLAGEGCSEGVREWVAQRYGHGSDAPFCVWSSYGSPYAGELAVETRETIALRQFFYRRPLQCREVFGTDQPPMLLLPLPHALLESVDGRIVATRDGMVPLIRFDTGDPGGVLGRERLFSLPELPADLLRLLPARIVYVHVRVPADTIPFFGLRLRMGDLHHWVLSLPESLGYAGVVKVTRDDSQGFTRFVFRVAVHGEIDAERTGAWQTHLLRLLRARLGGFAVRHDGVAEAMGETLVLVELMEACGEGVSSDEASRGGPAKIDGAESRNL